MKNECVCVCVMYANLCIGIHTMNAIISLCLQLLKEKAAG